MPYLTSPMIPVERPSATRARSCPSHTTRRLSERRGPPPFESRSLCASRLDHVADDRARGRTVARSCRRLRPRATAHGVPGDQRDHDHDDDHVHDDLFGAEHVEREHWLPPWWDAGSPAVATSRAPPSYGAAAPLCSRVPRPARTGI